MCVYLLDRPLVSSRIVAFILLLVEMGGSFCTSLGPLISTFLQLNVFGGGVERRFLISRTKRPHGFFMR
jgi:hypothetical protein